MLKTISITAILSIFLMGVMKTDSGIGNTFNNPDPTYSLEYAKFKKELPKTIVMEKTTREEVRLIMDQENEEDIINDISHWIDVLIRNEKLAETKLYKDLVEFVGQLIHEASFKVLVGCISEDIGFTYEELSEEVTNKLATFLSKSEATYSVGSLEKVLELQKTLLEKQNMEVDDIIKAATLEAFYLKKNEQQVKNYIKFLETQNQLSKESLFSVETDYLIHIGYNKDVMNFISNYIHRDELNVSSIINEKIAFMHITQTLQNRTPSQLEREILATIIERVSSYAYEEYITLEMHENWKQLASKLKNLFIDK